MPKVSIITPCYNGGQFLPETIDSVLAQTFTDWEMIIVDDCSNDGTSPAVIAEQAKRDKRIKVIWQKENKGVSAARNEAVRNAKGKYIACLDADDKFAPTYLEKTMATMESTDADVVYTHFELFGKRNEKRYYTKDQKKTKRILRFKCRFPVCALHKKADWKAFGGHNENMVAGVDRDYWLHFVEADKNLVLVDEVLFQYRDHENSLVKQASKIKLQTERITRANHPNLYKGFNYYFNIEFLKYGLRPWLFQLRTRKGVRVLRILGIYFIKPEEINPKDIYKKQ